MDEKIAIIDLGSNSARMIIMIIYSDGSYKMIDTLKEMVRLSEGMGKDNTLKEASISRTIHVLKIFRKIIDIQRVDKVYAIATAAVRNAVNREEFLKKVYENTKLSFDVISGEQEAYYDYLGIINTIDIDDCILLDTGGGSSEIILVKNRQAVQKISLPYGAVNLFERFAINGDWKIEAIHEMQSFLEKEILNIGWLKQAKDLPIVGLGGSIRALAKVYKKKNKLNIDGLHNIEIPTSETLAIYDKISKASLEERREMSGIGKDRADIIVSGLMPLKVLSDVVKAKTLIISGNGLREGVFYKHYLQNRDEEKFEDILTSSIENILKNYDVNEAHSQLVEKLALQMFDQMVFLHGYNGKQRKILSTASLLHDIGMYVDYYNHHQHGFYLTLNSKIYGLTNKEILMCAYLVAMHRNEDFRVDWKEYGSLLNKEDFEVIKKLSLFIRIAEELDRTEIGIVQGVECLVDKKEVIIKLRTTRSAELEKSVAMKSAKAFEKAFGRRLIIE